STATPPRGSSSAPAGRSHPTWGRRPTGGRPGNRRGPSTGARSPGIGPRARRGTSTGSRSPGGAGAGASLTATGGRARTAGGSATTAARGGSVAVPGVVSGGPAFGGAILTGNASPFGVARSTLDVSRSTFTGNTATGGNGGAAGLPGGEGAGGAVSVTNGGAVELSPNPFHDKHAARRGGGPRAPGGQAP